MSRISYEELSDRLTLEADQLFCEMALAHLEAGSGDRLFLRSDTMSGTGLHFRGPDISRSWHKFDGGAIEDLIAYGLLHLGHSSRGSQNYRVSGEGIHFYSWLMDQKGSPISQLEDVVRSAVSGEDFAVSHPGAARHLAKAFDLVWSDRTDTQTVAEIGEHLRGAIMDVASDVTNAAGPAEKPVEQLKTHLRENPEGVGDREAATLYALIELVEAVLRFDQRLTHIRDEESRGRPLVSWDELRRASFATAFACYEVSRSLG